MTEQTSTIVLDGDFVGHSFRGNQHVSASGESRGAVRSSQRAKHAEKHGDAKTQKKAHRTAHYAHMAAAEASGTHTTRKYHKKMAKFHGSRSGMTLDSVGVLDDADGFSLIEGVIRKGGKVVGRAQIGGDGKAMVFVGADGDTRAQFKSSMDGQMRDFMWSEDDGAQMVTALLASLKEPVTSAPAEVYAFKSASAEALGLLTIGAQNQAPQSTYKTAVSVEKSADSYGMNIRWEAVGGLPTFDDAEGGLFGDGDKGHVRGELSYNSQSLAMVYVREDGMAAFDYNGKTLRDSLGSDFDKFEDKYSGWTAYSNAIMYELKEACDVNFFAQRPASEIFVEGLIAAGWKDSGTSIYMQSEDGDVAIDFNKDADPWPKATLKVWIDGAWADVPEEVTEDAREWHDFPPNASEDEVASTLSKLLADAKTLQSWAESQREKTPAPTPAPAENDWTRLRAAMKVAPKDREVVASDDPQAIEKLTAKLHALTMNQEFMKKVNKLLKKGDDAALIEMGLSPEFIYKLKKPDFAGRTGYANYELSNNNGVISSTRKRLEQLQREAMAERDQAGAEAVPAPVAEEPKPEETPVSTPTPEANPAKAADVAYLQSLIDGTADMFADDIFERLEPMFAAYEQDAEMTDMLNRAAEAYSNAAVKAAQEALAG